MAERLSTEVLSLPVHPSLTEGELDTIASRDQQLLRGPGAREERMNVGVVGLGYMGGNHVRVYSEMQEANLVAVADTDEERLDAVRPALRSARLR